MREQTVRRFKSKTPLLPGMLKRSKYSRLRNDSLTSLEDRPIRMLPLKGDLDPGTPTHHGLSTLRDFIPRVANIRSQGPVSLRGLRGQTNPDRDRSTGVHTDRSLSHSALSCTQRPIITLHGRTSSLSRTRSCPPPCSQHREGRCCPRTCSAVDDCTSVQTALHRDIKYMGSVEVTQSMRTLDFDTRIQVTREAISRLCERASAKTTVKIKRPVCKRLSAVLGQVSLQFSGSRIILAVSTDSVTLIAASSSQKIAHHPMQAISFASGGDPDMADYIAYVAKDHFSQRACHILECPQGRASEVINSIGQAFETRFRQLLSHTPSLLSTNSRSAVRLCHKWRPVETVTDQKATRDSEASEHGDYYNMIPRRMTPAGGAEHLRITKEENQQGAVTQGVYLSQPVSLRENCTMTEETTAPPAVDSEVSAQHCTLLSERQIQDLFRGEGWFHGRLGREQAESLLTCSGDFLVRESSSASGQYVLSGMEGATVRHLLLVDPHGQVRTRDQVFVSVGHLVRFHMENQTPIVSGSSELCLKQPVLQRH